MVKDVSQVIYIADDDYVVEAEFVMFIAFYMGGKDIEEPECVFGVDAIEVVKD